MKYPEKATFLYISNSCRVFTDNVYIRYVKTSEFL